MSNHKSILIPITLEEGAELPSYASDLAAGADVRACIKEEMIILPGESALIPTGIKVAIPEGYEIQVRPRSGLALKNKITVLNTPGTIDADYRGVIGVILINHGREPFHVTQGMRIAQIVVAPVFQANFVQESSLTATVRGDGGFGHTGVQ
ncbi:MAG: dUTP diphosphatase [Rhabdochlamydiaceae bacterium]|nr:dUTP diphosphatase [Rhabdochlamydiaceae bacterium]